MWEGIGERDWIRFNDDSKHGKSDLDGQIVIARLRTGFSHIRVSHQIKYLTHACMSWYIKFMIILYQDQFKKTVLKIFSQLVLKLIDSYWNYDFLTQGGTLYSQKHILILSAS